MKPRTLQVLHFSEILFWHQRCAPRLEQPANLALQISLTVTVTAVFSLSSSLIP